MLFDGDAFPALLRWRLHLMVVGFLVVVEVEVAVVDGETVVEVVDSCFSGDFSPNLSSDFSLDFFGISHGVD